MATNRKKGHQADRWLGIDNALKAGVPQVRSALADEDDFRELRLKLRDDRTTLAILKAYGSDGGPVVCFGSGYGVVGALMALNASIAVGAWKTDKPWKPSKK